eukprot:CAMPEP_0197657344 /NCGR_PEP_ID=MMETSP1338-20131121/44569_1 /TAXON_ID=43686 ORGANISM="Pelagodinium beii, Strain RCC1491" /NCGR_SAMPLE_ID=MMETSP1338 /ASSEMBLY_ACC=CAM_ASM_000754 /LENGTH=893 /DNA_ID=CAMNT_0043233691 /DNA_START=38 /DNA_END=2719 /DNA_ORIENTATION=+
MMKPRMWLASMWGLALAQDRTRTLLDEGWKFYLEPLDIKNCSMADFPEDFTNKQCSGLTRQAQVTDAEWCQSTCCQDELCELWQFSANSSDWGGCWTGRKSGDCNDVKGWVSRGRKAPPPSPPPSPGPNPFSSADYDDSAWRTLDLPHDFVVEGQFSQRADVVHGFLPGRKGWYRLHFNVPAAIDGKVLWLDFDGVQRDSHAYLNGKIIGSHLSGYTAFRYDITDVVIPGGKNVLAISVDATKPDGWWYDGGGIYRHVWLNFASKLHIAPWGVYLPADVTGTISQETADATVAPITTVVNSGSTDIVVVVQSQIKDAAGEIVGTAKSHAATVKAGSNQSFNAELSIKSAKLWSIELPRLYSCETKLLVGSEQAEGDSVQDTFGIRKLHWDKDKGFALNDKPVKIKGFANHQDFAGVGVAVPDSLQKYRVWKMKDMGANAWRTAHNPPTPALLDECDKQGMLVWDENHRNRDSHDMVEDLRSMLLRDRNHPSIIMWSLCNEALCENFNDTTAKTLKPIFSELDPLGGRPMTAAMNGGYGTAFQDTLDVMGVNYHHQLYDDLHKHFPDQPMIGSETSSDYSDRSIYKNDNQKRMHVSAYDVNYPAWGATAEDAWCSIAQRSFMSGAFYWTGFDYKGEPTPYAWPNVNSHFGVIDIAGFPKDNFYYHQSVFFSPEERPMVHLLPHWNWKAGETIDVWAYTNVGHSVELILNNKSLGRQRVTPCRHLNWTVPFVAGQLKAVAYHTVDGGAFPVASDVISTSGPTEAINLETEWPDSGKLKADGTDTALVKVSLVDHQRRLVPTDSKQLRFSLSGPGKIIGLGNGDPSSHEPDKPDTPKLGTRTAWNGLARVVVQSTKEPGTIVLKAESADGPGLGFAAITIQSISEQTSEDRIDFFV